MDRPTDDLLSLEPEEVTASDEPRFRIVIDGDYAFEPIEPTDPENPPLELVGSYLMG